MCAKFVCRGSVQHALCIALFKIVALQATKLRSQGFTVLQPAATGSFATALCQQARHNGTFGYGADVEGCVAMAHYVSVDFEQVRT